MTRQSMYRVFGLIAVLTLITLMACHESMVVVEKSPQETDIEAHFALGDGELELLEMSPATEPPAVKPRNAQHNAFGELWYEFRDATGKLLAEGTTKDPRHVRGEWMEEGSWDRQDAFVEQGLLSVHLPRLDGELTVYEWTLDGPTVIASTEVVPAETSTEYSSLKQQLSGTGDILGIEHIHARSSGGNSLTLAITGDGYTESEMDQFRAAASNTINQLFASDFGNYADQIDIYRIDVASPVSGIGENGVRLNTPFGVTRDAEVRRLVFFDRVADRNIARSAGQQVGADQVVVLANSPGHGGAAVPGLVALTEGSPEYLDHELGHSLLDLADEYEVQNYLACSANTAGPNVSSSLSSLPWGNLIGDNTPVPTPESSQYSGQIGAFEGANRCESGWYRSQLNCRMRDAHPHFCAVCRHQMDRYFGTTNGDPGGGQSDDTGADASCDYSCSEYGYSEGQCNQGWQCQSGCLVHTSCDHGTNSGGTQSDDTTSDSSSNCTYHCADYNYSEGQCHGEWLCQNGCLTHTDCQADGIITSDSASQTGCTHTCTASQEGNCYGGWRCENGCLQDVGCSDDATTGGSSSCDYSCADYNYSEGQCHQDWLCQNGCLVHTDCGGGAGAQPLDCDFTCAEYGYEEGQCHDIWLCQNGCLVDVGQCD